MDPLIRDDLSQIHAAIANRWTRSDCTIVITGCAGFLGFYFLHYFLHHARELGIRRVVGLDTFLLGRPEWLDELAEKFPTLLRLHQFDISTQPLESIPGVAKADYVIHMASIASPVFYREYPLETIDANIWGLRRLLEFYRDNERLSGLLFFSSSEIYGDPAPSAIPTEEDYRGLVSCTGPRACYDESKRFGETICAIFAQKYKMPIVVARPFNNYGPGMRLGDKRLPADVASNILKGDDVVILSDGRPTRTFCYISDAVAGYLACLLHGRYDYFNIGMDKPEISVRQFVEISCEAGADLFGYEGKAIFAESLDQAYLIDNPNRRCPSIDKARRILGYEPTVSVQDGMRRYLTFLKRQKEG